MYGLGHHLVLAIVAYPSRMQLAFDSTRLGVLLWPEWAVLISQERVPSGQKLC